MAVSYRSPCCCSLSLLVHQQGSYGTPNVGLLLLLLSQVEVWHQTEDKNYVVKQKADWSQEQAALASSRQQQQPHPETTEDGQSHGGSEASSQAGSKQPLQGRDQDQQGDVASQESRQWANLLGRAEVALQDICDGELHEVELTLRM